MISISINYAGEIAKFIMYTFKENAFFANSGVGRKKAPHFPCFLSDPTGK